MVALAVLLLCAEGWLLPPSCISPAFRTRNTKLNMIQAGEQGPDANANVDIKIRKPTSSGGPQAATQGTVFMKVSFTHVKDSLSTFLKFWLMGGCGAIGWAGTGELNAKHTSGTLASIDVDVDASTVTLLSVSEDTYNTKRQLARYATALLDELEGLSKTEEAAAADRLCYPPQAIDSARMVVTVQLASATTQ